VTIDASDYGSASASCKIRLPRGGTQDAQGYPGSRSDMAVSTIEQTVRNVRCAHRVAGDCRRLHLIPTTHASQNLARHDRSNPRDACRGWPASQTLDSSVEILDVREMQTNSQGNHVRHRNYDGGDLVYGISERNGAAQISCPDCVRPADDVLTRLPRLPMRGLEPRRNGIVIHEVRSQRAALS